MQFVVSRIKIRNILFVAELTTFKWLSPFISKREEFSRIFIFSLHLQNMGLRQELDRLKNENMLLRDKLSKYTDV